MPVVDNIVSVARALQLAGSTSELGALPWLPLAVPTVPLYEHVGALQPRSSWISANQTAGAAGTYASFEVIPGARPCVVELFHSDSDVNLVIDPDRATATCTGGTLCTAMRNGPAPSEALVYMDTPAGTILLAAGPYMLDFDPTQKGNYPRFFVNTGRVMRIQHASAASAMALNLVVTDLL